jgi:hypothetical protein
MKGPGRRDVRALGGPKDDMSFTILPSRSPAQRHLACSS